MRRFATKYRGVPGWAIRAGQFGESPGLKKGLCKANAMKESNYVRYDVKRTGPKK